MQNVTPQSAPTVATATGGVRNNHRLLGALLALMALLLFPLTASAEAIPALNVLEVSDDGTEYSLSLQLLLLMTVLALLPSILILMTSFTRIIIVLSLLRQALGTAQTPPNQVLIGIALFLSLFIMAPVLENVYEDAFMPVQDGEISFMQGIELSLIHI